MSDESNELPVELYSTCPLSYGMGPADYRGFCGDVARWVEAAGYRGVLVFTDNYVLDPWLLAQYVIERTTALVPLVAVQPAYQQPLTAARMVGAIGYLFGRPVDLNFVTGGGGRELRAIGADPGHDARYDRLVEYTRIVTRLLTDPEPFTHEGAYYSFTGATVQPPLPPALAPRVFVAGSSPAGVNACRELGTTRLTYPQPAAEYESDPDALRGCGIRLGIIARDDGDEAWRVAHRRYPPDLHGEAVRVIQGTVSDSRWYHRLLRDAYQPHLAGTPYWLYPFRAFREFCPFLVGSYAEVGEYLARYLDLGITTLILATPHEEDDLHHNRIALRHAVAGAAQTVGPAPA